MMSLESVMKRIREMLDDMTLRPREKCWEKEVCYGRWWWEPCIARDALEVLVDGGSVRRRQEQRPVDLSVLPDSKIDCTDLYGVGWVFYDNYSIRYIEENKIKPRMKHWFSDRNFDNSISLINRLWVAGFEMETTTGGFRILGLRPGYCWPWEMSDV